MIDHGRRTRLDEEESLEGTQPPLADQVVRESGGVIGIGLEHDAELTRPLLLRDREVEGEVRGV